jgi:hypothetical protein
MTPFGESWDMTTLEAAEGVLDRPRGTETLDVRRVRPRDQFGAIGLLLGILGVLLAVVVTVGSAPPFVR